jgi:hypothetical protein
MSCGCSKTVHTIASGLVGLTMSAVGPTASPEVIAERTATCNACEHKVWDGRRAVCGRCKCWLPAKRRIREPQCDRFQR